MKTKEHPINGPRARVIVIADGRVVEDRMMRMVKGSDVRNKAASRKRKPSRRNGKSHK
jgi:hypothetical protein